MCTCVTVTQYITWYICVSVQVVMCKEKETGETVAIKMFRKDMIGTNDEILCAVTEQKEFHKTKHPFLSVCQKCSLCCVS